MKKIILLVGIITCGFTNMVNGQSVNEYIRKNNEYFVLNDESYIRLKEYKTNYGNKIYIVGGVSYYDISNMELYNNIYKSGVLKMQDSFFVITKDGQNQGISKTDNYFNSKMCLTINKDTYNLLTNHIEALIIPKASVYGIIDGELPCYLYGNNLIFSSNSMYDDDLYYFVKNSSKIASEIKSIPISIKYNQNKLDLVYSVYKYILGRTDYNYKALQNLDAYKDIYYPWYASSVFQKYQVVCDGYIRAFMFILNFNGIKGERIVGKIQPIDSTELNAQGLLHSWLKVDNFYYDPTFDDSDGKESFEYFHKSQECFNLNHYTTGWILFDTYEKRYDYIKNNGRLLIDNCVEILRNSLYNDDKLVDFIKYSLENYPLIVNSKLACSIFEECSGGFKSNQEIVDKISKYVLSYSSGNGTKKYYLNEQFKNFKVGSNQDENNSSAVLTSQAPKLYQLTAKDKLFIEDFFQKIQNKIKNQTLTKRIVYYKNLSSKLDIIINTKKLSSKNKKLLEYLNQLIKNHLNTIK